MRSKIGGFCMFLGAVMLSCGLGLLIYNQWQSEKAQQTAAAVMPRLVAEIAENPVSEELPSDGEATDMEPMFPAAMPEEMPEVTIDGYAYIGYISIPVLELELPVMADWDYPRLRVAPCRFSGTIYNDDLVVMAHNYWHHFGQLDQLKMGDTVLFTDMNGTVTAYQVVLRDILSPTAVEEMTAGDFGLTLFTCTYGGESRVTVYCDRVSG